MTVSAPPRPPSPARAAPESKPLERDEIEALVEALIEEARRETSRRHRRYWALAGLVTFVGVVVLILLDGGAASQIASPAVSARTNAAAQTGASKIAFISEPPGGGYCGTVYVMNADGSGQRRLTNGGVPGCGQEGGHTWSPDGRQIAINATNGIYVMNADGSGERRLTSGIGSENAAWSPDGRRIAFVMRGRAGSSGIYVINADGTEQRLRSRSPRHWSGQLTWSPNGEKIAFTIELPKAPAAQTRDFEIYVVNADGSGQRRLTRSPVRDNDPVWSPDGRRIAFESNWQLWVMNADGSGKRRLTRQGAHNFNPAWSPDGKRIAFERGRREREPSSGAAGSWGFGLYVMNADGSGQQRLTQGGSQPYWSPDGRKIAFVSNRDGNSDIHVMNADGSGRRNLTRAAGNRESQPLWSPAQK
jgi:Tol biopolymer transport system component